MEKILAEEDSSGGNLCIMSLLHHNCLAFFIKRYLAIYVLLLLRIEQAEPNKLAVIKENN